MIENTYVFVINMILQGSSLLIKRCFMFEIFASPGLHVLEGDDCRAPMHCDASDDVAERTQNKGNGIVPLFPFHCSTLHTPLFAIDTLTSLPSTYV